MRLQVLSRFMLGEQDVTEIGEGSLWHWDSTSSQLSVVWPSPSSGMSIQQVTAKALNVSLGFGISDMQPLAVVLAADATIAAESLSSFGGQMPDTMVHAECLTQVLLMLRRWT